MFCFPEEKARVLNDQNIEIDNCIVLVTVCCYEAENRLGAK